MNCSYSSLAWTPFVQGFYFHLFIHLYFFFFVFIFHFTSVYLPVLLLCVRAFWAIRYSYRIISLTHTRSTHCIHTSSSDHHFNCLYPTAHICTHTHTHTQALTGTYAHPTEHPNNQRSNQLANSLFLFDTFYCCGGNV